MASKKDMRREDLGQYPCSGPALCRATYEHSARSILTQHIAIGYIEPAKDNKEGAGDFIGESTLTPSALTRFGGLVVEDLSQTIPFSAEKSLI